MKEKRLIMLIVVIGLILNGQIFAAEKAKTSKKVKETTQAPKVAAADPLVQANKDIKALQEKMAKIKEAFSKKDLKTIKTLSDEYVSLINILCSQIDAIGAAGKDTTSLWKALLESTQKDRQTIASFGKISDEQSAALRGVSEYSMRVNETAAKRLSR